MPVKLDQFPNFRDENFQKMFETSTWSPYLKLTWPLKMGASPPPSFSWGSTGWSPEAHGLPCGFSRSKSQSHEKESTQAAWGRRWAFEKNPNG